MIIEVLRDSLDIATTRCRVTHPEKLIYNLNNKYIMYIQSVDYNKAELICRFKYTVKSSDGNLIEEDIIDCSCLDHQTMEMINDTYIWTSTQKEIDKESMTDMIPNTLCEIYDIIDFFKSIKND